LQKWNCSLKRKPAILEVNMKNQLLP